jgi:hypothetical protein
VDPAVAEPDARRPLIVDADGCGEGVELVFADQAVVAQRFDVEQPSVGRKADLP